MARRATVLALIASIATGAAAAPILAQDGPLTLQQVERKYPRMNAVHIGKCDHDDDGLYSRTEMLCVQSIYSTMYVNDH